MPARLFSTQMFQARAPIELLCCAALLSLTACGSSEEDRRSEEDRVRDAVTKHGRAVASGDAAALCALSTAASRRSLADVAELQRLAAGEDPKAAERARCGDARLERSATHEVVSVTIKDGVARVKVKRDSEAAVETFRREGGAWRNDRIYPTTVANVELLPLHCVQSWHDNANRATRTRVLPATVDLPAPALLEEVEGGRGCRMLVRGDDGVAVFERGTSGVWAAVAEPVPPAEEPRARFNLRVFEDGLPQWLPDVARGAPRPTEEAVGIPPPGQDPPPDPAAPATAPWQDCGRILSPVDRRPLRVETRGFDCTTARRYAVGFLKDQSLPPGWGPADCGASRPSCEREGQGFRIVK